MVVGIVVGRGRGARVCHRTRKKLSTNGGIALVIDDMIYNVIMNVVRHRNFTDLFIIRPRVISDGRT